MQFDDLPIAPVTPELAKASHPATEAAQKPTAQSISRTPQGELTIGWSDGSFTLYSPRDLRIKCPCAACVDEWSGEPTLDPTTIANDITLANLYTVGRYALGITFTDGHRGGIFTFDSLRKMTQ